MAGEGADQFFLALLAQNEFLGLVGLGKIADPSTNEAQVDLQKTAIAIGTLEMLERKTRGNLSADEERELRRTLTTLRLNYVEELSQARKGGGQAPTAGAESGAKDSDSAEERAEASEGAASEGVGQDGPAQARGEQPTE